MEAYLDIIQCNCIMRSERDVRLSPGSTVRDTVARHADELDASTELLFHFFMLLARKPSSKARLRSILPLCSSRLSFLNLHCISIYKFATEGGQMNNLTTSPPQRGRIQILAYRCTYIFTLWLLYITVNSELPYETPFNRQNRQSKQASEAKHHGGFYREWTLIMILSNPPFAKKQALH